ncbi:GNAT family N-acetyltransferase [Winogradskyella sp.]|uniref:GNAT family N-acetyltransferase n=1 Tax=Winogradskyella sp. TaxID=1883156 RepID=UPI0025F55C9C|nr:GNAT family N-acetyltransferase [Winogradskyella sp.]MBT8245064.1 GNAT family N-acetyltransferase [Winogradskyella sp.]
MISISDSIQLKTITIKDHSKLVLLLQRIYPPAYKHLWLNEDCSFYFNKFYSKENLEIELSNQNAEYYFVLYNSNRVGILRFVHHTPFEDLPRRKSTYLNRIYLGKEAQGKGVAQQLFSWTEHCVKQNGGDLIWLKVMDSQKQALRFYKKQGYKQGEPTNLDFELIHPSLRGMYTMYKLIF